MTRGLRAHSRGPKWLTFVVGSGLIGSSTMSAAATIPVTPTGLTAQVVQTSVYLRWQKNPESGITGYAMSREKSDGTWATSGVASSAIYLLTNLTSGVKYTYRVAALNTEGNRSAPSEAISFTPRDTIPPPLPTGLKATADDTQIQLSWASSTAGDFDHFSVYRLYPNGTSPTTPTATTTSAAFTDTALSDGTAYTYRVVAVDHVGNESSASTTVPATPRDTTPPVAPEGLAAQGPLDEQASLVWTASTDPRLDHYDVYKKSSDGTWPTSPRATVAAHGLSSGPVVTFTESGLVDGEVYAYRVITVDQAGNEYVTSVAAEVTAAPRDTAPPPAPEGLSAPDAEDERVVLTWTASADARRDHYDVYRRNPDGTWPAAPTAVTTAPAFIDTNVSDGTIYAYRVAAVDRAGVEIVESLPSAVVVAHPADTTPPSAPEGVLAQSGEDERVALTWTAGVDLRRDHYAIYRENADGTWPPRPGEVSTAASFTDTGLSDGTAYSYRVAVVDHVGTEDIESAPSVVVTARPTDTTPPGAPEGLKGQSGQESRAYLSWAASTDPRRDHYDVYRRNQDGTWPGAPTAEIEGAVYTDTGLEDGTTYTYRVIAVDHAGTEDVESAPSATATATPKDITSPAAPTGLNVTGGDAANELVWATNTEPDFDHYAVYRENADGTWPTTLMATTKASTYTDGAVYGGTEYTYRVTAVDHTTNESAPSAAASATPTETSPPAPPAQPVLTTGEGQLGISWWRSIEFNVTRYAVYRAEPGGAWPSAPVGETTHNWWTDTGLSNGTSYEYRVVAVNRAGLSSQSSTAVQGKPGAVAVADPGPVFSATSPWNEPLDTAAAVDPNSQLMMTGTDPVTGVRAEGAQGGLLASIAKSGTALEAYSGYSSPDYVVPANQPLVPVHVIEPSVLNHVALERELSLGVPIPPNAQSAAGTDGHMTIYQPATETLWDLWRACSPEGPNNEETWVAAQSCPKAPAATWTVQYGGVMRNVAQSLGYFDANSDPGASAFNWGSTATSLPVATGMVTMAELQAGQINHALALDVPGYGLPGAACAYNNWRLPNNMGVTPVVWPAQRSDGTYVGSDCVPEGARLRIEPDFDLNSVQLPKVARMFAVAAQRYGMIVRDHDAGGVSFFAEDPVSLRQLGVKLNPYTGQAWTNAGSSPTQSSLLAGAPTWSLFKNFPWSHVQVLRMTVCRAFLSPCPAAGD